VARATGAYKSAVGSMAVGLDCVDSMAVGEECGGAGSPRCCWRLDQNETMTQPERDNELDGCGKLSTEQSRCMAMNTCVDGVESMILDGEAMRAQWRWSSTHPSELNGDGLANHWV
jgi:hypothetical protein